MDAAESITITFTPCFQKMGGRNRGRYACSGEGFELGARRDLQDRAGREDGDAPCRLLVLLGVMCHRSGGDQGVHAPCRADEAARLMKPDKGSGASATPPHQVGSGEGGRAWRSHPWLTRLPYFTRGSGSPLACADMAWIGGAVLRAPIMCASSKSGSHHMPQADLQVVALLLIRSRVTTGRASSRSLLLPSSHQQLGSVHYTRAFAVSLESSSSAIQNEVVITVLMLCKFF